MSSKHSIALRKAILKYEPKNKNRLKNVLLVILAISLTAIINLQARGVIKESGLENVYTSFKTVFSPKTEKKGEILPEVKQVMAQTEQAMSPEDAFSPFKEACLPINTTVNSPFGYREDPFTGEKILHRGTDLTASVGTDVKAVLDGKVIKVSEDEIGGIFLEIQHDNGFISYYGHLSKALVKVGDIVKKAQVVALTGDTGKVTGPHLHFQLMYNDRYVNPEVYFKFNEE